MDEYLRIVKKIFDEGEEKENLRTGEKTTSYPGITFEYDMRSGRFPLLTTKYVNAKLVATELEGFINAKTDKSWYQRKNCHIWDDWCNPQKLKEYSFEKQDLEDTVSHFMKEYDSKKNLVKTKRLETLVERVDKDAYENFEKKVEDAKKLSQYMINDLGPIYGFQWRHFGAQYSDEHANYNGKGIDQLKKSIDTLKEDPSSRRIIISAWNPQDLSKMALDPCHYTIQLLANKGKISLLWEQRSVDTMLGLPFNIASYAMLLKSLSLETQLAPYRLVGFLGDTHIYSKHKKGAQEQLKRKPKTLPRIELKNFTSTLEFKAENVEISEYDYYPAINLSIAV